MAGKAHPTHRLMETQGLLWCSKCGAHARRVPRALCRPCVWAPRSTAYTQLLRRLRRGMLPKCLEGGSPPVVPRKPRLLATTPVDVRDEASAGTPRSTLQASACCGQPLPSSTRSMASHALHMAQMTGETFPSCCVHDQAGSPRGS